MLLAYLALPAGHAHSRDKLAALLWGDRQDAQARASLRNAIAALRAVLGAEAIRGERDMVELKLVHISTDIDRLAAAAAAESAVGDAFLQLALRTELLEGGRAAVGKLRGLALFRAHALRRPCCARGPARHRHA